MRPTAADPACASRLVRMWDELDSELAALDSAHAEAMKSLAIRADDSNPATTTTGGPPGSV